MAGQRTTLPLNPFDVLVDPSEVEASKDKMWDFEDDLYLEGIMDSEAEEDI